MVDYPSMENTSIDIFNNKFFVHSGQVLDGVKLNYNYFSKQKLKGSVLNKIRVWPVTRVRLNEWYIRKRDFIKFKSR